jgi:hypothetical protein
MKLNKKIGYMISSVFLFIGTLWWTIGVLLMPDPNSFLYQIVWGFIYFGLIFGGGFAILSFFIPNETGGKPDKQEVQNNV